MSSPSMDIPAIAIHQVYKRFKNDSGTELEALKDVSLTIRRGEIFGLLGPNGAGKTTLISILAGLTRATKGTIQVNGHDVVNDRLAARRSVGVVPQEMVFDPFFTVRESLRFQSGYYGIKNNDVWIDELLSKLQLTDKAHVNMRRLSGGMKRRVMVAQAIVHKPDVIVLDEPTAGVDVELRQSLWQFMRELNHAGHTVLLTTHYLEEAQQICERIALLKNGQVVAVDSVDRLLSGASKTQLHIEVSQGVLPPAMQQTRLSEQKARYLISHPNEVGVILQAISQAGLEITRMSLEESDLEDVFLQLIQS